MAAPIFLFLKFLCFSSFSFVYLDSVSTKEFVNDFLKRRQRSRANFISITRNQYPRGRPSVSKVISSLIREPERTEQTSGLGMSLCLSVFV
jgi:hypothetical protein